MERVQDILDRLAGIETCDDDALAALEADILEVQEEITAEATTEESINALTRLNDALESVYAEVGARYEASAELTRRAQEQLDRARALRGETDDESELEEMVPGDDAENTDEPAEADGDTDGEDDDEDEEAEPEPERKRQPARAAAATRRPATAAPMAQVSARTPSAATQQRQRQTARGNGRPAPKIVAAPDLRSFHAGQELDWDQVALAVAEMLDVSRGAHAGAPIFRRVATVDWRDQYPEDRRITANMDPEEAARRIRNLTMPYGAPVGPHQGPLVAAGGLCAPLEVRYDVVDLTTAERPLRAGLPGMRADRGGLTWMPSPTLGDIIVDDTGGAIDTITIADDEPGTYQKTVQEFDCPDATDIEVTAISERLRFGNSADRFWPENVRATSNTARAAHSRRAERGLYESMRSQSILLNADPAATPVGAWPHFLAVIARAARGYRYQFRLDEEATLRVVMPTWLVDLLFIDLIYQAPGDGLTTSRINARQLITSQLADLNVTPIWQRDDARTDDANGAGGPAFTAVTAAGNLVDYDGVVSVLLFHEGAFLFLDGGQLDLGIVRDSTLNTLNRWEMFFEIWEAVAMVGYASWNLTIDVCANGTRAALATLDCGAIGS